MLYAVCLFEEREEIQEKAVKEYGEEAVQANEGMLLIQTLEPLQKVAERLGIRTKAKQENLHRGAVFGLNGRVAGFGPPELADWVGKRV